ncbi:MAG: STAS domain-containing protein [Betaproteobacteria bacterium]|nr:STAS domain-containing protein [Betaproteobacteria bacterium]
MIRREGERACVDGPVTLANVTRVLEEGYAQLRSGARIVDLAGVTELDSSLLAALLAWLRDARSRNAELAFANLPEGLTTIARLYGVAELLPQDAASH